MKNYVDLGIKILNEGILEKTRVGNAYALHGESLSFNLKEGFPLLTTKKVGHKSIIHEALWYLKGTTSIDYLESNKVFVWSKFANEHNDIGKTYSFQFRNFNGIDQVAESIKKLQDSSYTDRRNIINLYNVSDLAEMSIPPCISLIQLYTYFDDKNVKQLDLVAYQRSADFCLGVPYDIAEMAVLANVFAAYGDAEPNKLIIQYGNVHVYKVHADTLELQLKEKPEKLPVLEVDREAIKAVQPEDIKAEMFTITGIKKDRTVYSYELL